MEDLGYKHQGYTVGYDTMSQIRWLSVLDLKDKTEDQLLKEMDYQTRRNIKKTYEMGVQVKTLPIEETDTFFELFQMAEENMVSNSVKNLTSKICKNVWRSCNAETCLYRLTRLPKYITRKHDNLEKQLKEVEKH